MRSVNIWLFQVMQKRKLEKQGINKISISPDVPPPLIVSETDSLSFDNATVPTQEEGVQDVDEEAIVKGLLHEVEKQLNIEGMFVSPSLLHNTKKFNIVFC